MLKQSEIATIILVAALALGASFFIANAVISPGERKQDVLSVQAIDTNFPEIDESIFPKDGLNPTQQVRIGENNPDAPFQQSDN